MSYEITITETRTVVKKVGKEWAILGTKEVSRDNEIYDMDKAGGRTRIEDVHGYTPEIEKSIDEKREIFRQTVEDLDLSAVIRAINSL
jgi:hypothetical protein